MSIPRFAGARERGGDLGLRHSVAGRMPVVVVVGLEMVDVAEHHRQRLGAPLRLAILALDEDRRRRLAMPVSRPGATAIRASAGFAQLGRKGHQRCAGLVEPLQRAHLGAQHHLGWTGFDEV